jgi:phosphotransferase system enzyme I (PtsI)
LTGETTARQEFRGIGASEGIAIGRAYRYTPLDLTFPPRPTVGKEAEWARFEAARKTAGKELQALRDRVAARLGQEEAAIFEAHQVMLDDPMLAAAVSKRLDRGEIVEQALTEATHELSEMLAGMAEELFAARAADVQDVGKRMLRILLGRGESAPTMLSEPAIVVAQDLSPSDTAELDPTLILGLATAGGGLMSHTAILARTLDIPAVVALGERLLDEVPTGTEVIVDGSDGVVLVSPDGSTREKHRVLQARRRSSLEAARLHVDRQARTADGRRVEVAANVGDIVSARRAAAQGAEGIGLLRTEFLYFDQVRPPTEDHQVHIYREIFEAMPGRPIIVRTLDVGGDKPPPYLSFPDEANPFLGWRAIRISLERTDLFRAQLRAILRAGEGHSIRIMFPMINDLDELKRAREIIEEVRAGLQREGLPFAREVPVGIMVETPAAATMADVLARAADFFSLGTNDLTQYTLAVDRGNPKVASLFQPLHPAVLRLIRQTIEVAHAAGKWVGMCGELAGMRMAIPILVGLGLDELSMVPAAIPPTKELISRLRDDAAAFVARQALSLGTSAEVETLMRGFLSKLG